MRKTQDRDFTPALGYSVLTPLYDLALAAFTRQSMWRPALVRQVAARPGERIVDVGSGTGTLTRALKRGVPSSVIIGVDPDPAILARARAKATAEGLRIQYVEGFFDRNLFASTGRSTRS